MSSFVPLDLLGYRVVGRDYTPHGWWWAGMMRLNLDRQGSVGFFLFFLSSEGSGIMADPAWTPLPLGKARVADGRWPMAERTTHNGMRCAAWLAGSRSVRKEDGGRGTGDGVDYERGCEGRTQLSPALLTCWRRPRSNVEGPASYSVVCWQC